MKSRLFFVVQSCLLILAMVLVSFGQSAMAAKMRNVWGQMVEKPRYGGTFTIASTMDFKHADPWYNWQGTIVVAPVLEHLGIGNWAIPKEKYPFDSGFVTVDVIKPHLAESWSMPDPTTIIFKIRKGIHWQNKPPMNGRELDAYDVEYSFARVRGVGEWKKQGKSPYAHLVNSAPITSIKATDKWTVVVKSSKFSFTTLKGVYWASWEGAWISPKEVLQKYGHHKDWRNVVGTGPYMFKDHVEGASWTYERNPNYWYKDERFPGMRLPFADTLKVLIIPERATRLAAMRSGKIDALGGLKPEEEEALKKSNPEVNFHYATGSNGDRDSAMQILKPPFNDIRVRKAMQKALNLKEIADYYYKGKADSEHYGIGGPTVVQLGYDVSFKDWPESVKEGYRYDPEAAKKLLKEAGYPNGFKFKYTTFATHDNDLLQLYKAYWSVIGVEAEIEVTNDQAAAYNRAYKGDFQMNVIGQRATNYTPLGRVNSAQCKNKENFSQFCDQKYEALAKKVYSATDTESYRKAVKAASTYWAAQHLTLSNAQPLVISASQPWVKGGFWGQYATGGGGMIWTIWSRFWVDEQLKK